MKRTLFLLMALIVGGISPLFAQSLIGKWNAMLPAETEEDVPVSMTLTFASDNSATMNMAFSQEIDEIGVFNCSISLKGTYNYNAPNCKLNFDAKTPNIESGMQYNEAMKEVFAKNPDLKDQLSISLREGLEEGLKETREVLYNSFNDVSFVIKNLTSDSFDFVDAQTIHFVRVKPTK